MTAKTVLLLLFCFIFIPDFNFNSYTAAFETRNAVMTNECYDISTDYGHNKYNMRFVEAADLYFFKLKDDSCESPGDVTITPIFDFKKFSCNSFETTTTTTTIITNITTTNTTTTTEEPPTRKRDSFPSNPSQEEYSIHLRFDRSEDDESLLTNLNFHFASDSENFTFSSSLKFKTRGVISHREMDKYVYSYNSSEEVFCGLFVNGICAGFCYNTPPLWGGVPEDKNLEEISVSQITTEDSFTTTTDNVERLEDVYDDDDDNYKNPPSAKHFPLGKNVKILLYAFSGILIVLVLTSLYTFYNISQKRGIYIL